MASIDLVALLCCCVRGCLVAQRYIAHDLLRVQDLLRPGADAVRVGSFILDLPDDQRQRLLSALTGAIDISVKAELAHKTGSATHDLVTTADVLTQEVLVRMLRDAFPDLPFTIVGEEESASSAALQARVEECLRKYCDNNDDGGDIAGQNAAQAAHSTRTTAESLVVPHEQQLRDHVASQPLSSPRGGAAPERGSQGVARGVVWAADLQALRARVALYIDPIDGTNCFVQGQWQVPMSLVGITVDGVPVAGVANRVFCYPVVSVPSRQDAREGTALCTRGLSYVWNAVSNPVRAPCPFIVYNGQRMTLPSPSQQRAATCEAKTPATTPAIAVAVTGEVRRGGQAGIDGGAIASVLSHAGARQPADVLSVTYSSTTREQTLQHVLRHLQPLRSCLARGAGNKLLRLVHQSLQDCGAFVCRDHSENGYKGAADLVKQGEAWTGADVFLSPGNALCRWDCCAAQAFLVALGGRVYDLSGRVLRYDIPTTVTASASTDGVSAAAALATGGDRSETSKEPSAQSMGSQGHATRSIATTCAPPSSSAKLSDGVLAVTAAARAEVVRRMQWQA